MLKIIKVSVFPPFHICRVARPDNLISINTNQSDESMVEAAIYEVHGKVIHLVPKI
jgi:hypothetical protein